MTFEVSLDRRFTKTPVGEGAARVRDKDLDSPGATVTPDGKTMSPATTGAASTDVKTAIAAKEMSEFSITKAIRDLPQPVYELRVSHFTITALESEVESDELFGRRVWGLKNRGVY
jgi:hypothetical protein